LILFWLRLVMSGAGYAVYSHSPVVKNYVDEHLPENMKGLKLGLPYPFSVTAVKRRAGYENVEADVDASGAPSPSPRRRTKLNLHLPMTFPSWSGTRAGLGLSNIGSSIGAVGSGLGKKGRRTFLGRPDAERLRTWQLEEEFDLGEEFAGPATGAGAGASSRLGDEEGAWVNANGSGDAGAGALSARSSRSKSKSGRWSQWIPSSPLRFSHAGSHSAIPATDVDYDADVEQQVEFEYDEGVPLAPSPRKFGGGVRGGHGFSRGYGSAG
jgi:hypothetical protein